MMQPSHPDHDKPRRHWRTQLDQGQAQAADILAYLLAGPLTFGGLGWLVDRWATTAVFLPLGIIAGLALGIYVITVRYGGGWRAR